MHRAPDHEHNGTPEHEGGRALLHKGCRTETPGGGRDPATSTGGEQIVPTLTRKVGTNGDSSNLFKGIPWGNSQTFPQQGLTCSNPRNTLRRISRAYGKVPTPSTFISRMVAWCTSRSMVSSAAYCARFYARGPLRSSPGV